MGQTTNLGSLAIGEESAVKTPGSTALKHPIRGEDFLNPLTFDPSGEFRDDRLTTRYDLIAEEAAGGLDANFRYGVNDYIIEGVFASVWGTGAYRDNAESATDITDISTSAFTVASGTAFVVGALVLAEGNPDAANNGIFEVDTGASTTSCPVTATLTADASPAATSRLTTVGLIGTTGDLVAVSDGITSTALDFTDFSLLKKDAWIKIGGTATGERFTSEPQNNTWAKIVSVEANKITLTNLPSTWAADTGTGKTIKIWFSELISIGDGTLKQSYFIQKRIPIAGGTRYLKLLGCYPSLFRIDTTARGRITSRIEFQGCQGLFDDTAIVGSPTEIGRHPFLSNTPRRPFVSGRSIVRLQEGSGAYSSGSFCVPSINFAIQNQLIPVECVDTLGYDDMEFGEAQTSQSGSINLQTASVYEKFRGETESSISCIMAQDQQAYVLDSPRGIFTTANINLPGPNQLIQIPFTFTADENVDGNSGANNKQYGMARFRYYEA